MPLIIVDENYCLFFSSFATLFYFVLRLCWFCHRFNSSLLLTVVRKNYFGPSKYTSMVQATKDIFREEGFAVLIIQFNLVS